MIIVYKIYIMKAIFHKCTLVGGKVVILVDVLVVNMLGEIGVFICESVVTYRDFNCLAMN